MVVVGCGLLFWNEGRAVKTAVSLEGEYRNHNPLSLGLKSHPAFPLQRFSLNAKKLSRKSNLLLFIYDGFLSL
jgi:hypothetical protein